MSGLDGVRQDTLPYVHRRFWREWMAAIKAEHPDLRVVGELFDADPALVSFYQGGAPRFDGIDSGIDTLFDFPLYFALREAFAKTGSLRDVAKALARDHLYPDASPLVTFLGLHDVPRFTTEPGASLDGLRAAFTLLATARGTPLVYYGDEIAMPGGGDPDNRRDFPGGWKEDPRSAFERAGRTPEEESVHAHVRTLLRLRQQAPALRRGRMVNLLVSDDAWVYARVHEVTAAVVAIHLGKQAVSLDVPVSALSLPEGARLEDRLASGAAARVEGETLRLFLPARSSAVFLAP
jgi:glycosidase